MMQSELLIQTSWPSYGPNMGFYESEYHNYPSPINSTPENSLISSDPYVESPLLGYEIENASMVDIDTHNIKAFDDVCRWLCDENQEIEEIQSEKSTESVHVSSPDLSMSSDDVMELESQTGMEDLMKAYADAMEMGQIELVKVIVKCVNEKTNPIGPVIDRIAFNLFKSAENQGDEYLKEELMRNFKQAFRAFYDIFPYGRFAHFTANSVILEAVPSHVESIHIVDFDLGEGSQWPPVIKAVAQQRRSLTITCVKLEEHDIEFKETKWQLCNYARDVGVSLKVEEVEFAQLVKVIMERKVNREFLAFNCMIGLPHMRSTRKRTQVIEFLKLAKEVLAKTEGIITFGDGENGDMVQNSPNYPSFFDGNLSRYKALYESMEWGFPSYLNEARIALETLFIAPLISSLSWFQKWEEGKEVVSLKNLGLQGQSMSIESSNEGMELVNERESPYGIGIGGDNGNEMVLEWRGTPLVKVSAWCK
ncbi:hypothetical protein L2E82_21180 [Cichorium intybus]|uniref:Uncharacterized protein n=1 Tax=Cichorium intybus TaxID=13427 RepID=A0ACB9DV35_CICIN|nr:hypothetical protein L2E82_21180 [Cichorium intybus]